MKSKTTRNWFKWTNVSALWSESLSERYSSFNVVPSQRVLFGRIWAAWLVICFVIFHQLSFCSSCLLFEKVFDHNQMAVPGHIKTDYYLCTGNVSSALKAQFNANLHNLHIVFVLSVIISRFSFSVCQRPKMLPQS